MYLSVWYWLSMSTNNQKDINYVSVAANGPIALDAGSPDSRCVSLNGFQADVDLLIRGYGLTLQDTTKYASILKLSNKTTNLVFDGVNISNGNENSIDLNHVSNIKLTNCNFGVTKYCEPCSVEPDQIITIKGGSTNIIVEGKIWKRGKRSNIDVFIGCWSDQSYAKSSNIELNLISSDGKPINVCFGRADEKTIKLGGSCVKMKWTSIGAKIHWYTKLAIRRFWGLQEGDKGPSWI